MNTSNPTHPEANCLDSDCPQHGTPKSDPSALGRAVEVLNRERWRGFDTWAPTGELITLVRARGAICDIYELDALAIAERFELRERVAVLTKQLAVTAAFLRQERATELHNTGKYYKMKDEAEQLREQVKALEAEQDRDYLCLNHVAGAMHEDVDCIACFEADRLRAELARREEAVAPFLEIAEQIPESDEPVEISYHGPDPTLFYGDAMDVADWRALLAAHKKENA